MKKIALVSFGVFAAFVGVLVFVLASHQSKPEFASSKYTAFHYEIKDEKLFKSALRRLKNGDFNLSARGEFLPNSYLSLDSGEFLELASGLLKPSGAQDLTLELVLRENNQTDPRKLNELCRIYNASLELKITQDTVLFRSYSEILGSKPEIQAHLESLMKFIADL